MVMATVAQPVTDEFMNVPTVRDPSPEDLRPLLGSILPPAPDRALSLVLDIPPVESRVLRPIYIPVNSYVPLLYVMAEAPGDNSAGIQRVISRMEAGAITYTVNKAVFTWIPPTHPSSVR